MPVSIRPPTFLLLSLHSSACLHLSSSIWGVLISPFTLVSFYQTQLNQGIHVFTHKMCFSKFLNIPYSASTCLILSSLKQLTRIVWWLQRTFHQCYLIQLSLHLLPARNTSPNTYSSPKPFGYAHSSFSICTKLGKHGYISSSIIQVMSFKFIVQKKQTERILVRLAKEDFLNTGLIINVIPLPFVEALKSSAIKFSFCAAQPRT